MILTYCLNPCFNGIYSLRELSLRYAVRAIGLNPCFNGIYSLSVRAICIHERKAVVLILVLMEYTH